MKNTFERFNGLNANEVKELIKQFGSLDNMNDTQNESPTMAEFLEMVNTYPEIKFIGYIVKKPREDYRVSITGFTLNNINADVAINLMSEYGYADEHDADKIEIGTYNLRFWWD